MHYSIKNAFIFSLVYISFEVGMIIAGLQYSENASFLSYAASSGALMFAIALTLYTSAKENAPQGFIGDIKHGLRTSGLYAIITALFIVMYHLYLVPDYADIRIEMVKETAMNTPLDVIQENNSGISQEDFVAMQTDNASFWLTPKKIFPMVLLGVMLLGFMYTFVFTAIFRKVLFRN